MPQATIILSTMGNNISIVVPTYNSQSYIADSLATIMQAVIPLFKDIELVVVNDGGNLDIEGILTKLKNSYGIAVTYIILKRNNGQFWSTNVGIVNAQYDTIITIDDDLSYPPASIASLVKLAKQDKFVVYGTVKKSGFLHLSRIAVYWLCSKKMGSSLRYFSRGLIDNPAELNVPIDVYFEGLPDFKNYYTNIYIPEGKQKANHPNLNLKSLWRKIGIAFNYTYIYPKNKLPYLIALNAMLAFVLLMLNHIVWAFVVTPTFILGVAGMLKYYLSPLKRRVSEIEYEIKRL